MTDPHSLPDFCELSTLYGDDDDRDANHDPTALKVKVTATDTTSERPPCNKRKRRLSFSSCSSNDDDDGVDTSPVKRSWSHGCERSTSLASFSQVSHVQPRRGARMRMDESKWPCESLL